MRIFFCIFLGLSLPAMAQGVKMQNKIHFKVSQQKASLPGPYEQPLESKEMCDPSEKTQMPETFY